jgi:SAM-dependent methyltransferase
MLTVVDYVQSWHDAHPGATSTAMSGPTDEHGRTSYELLVEEIPPGDGHVVDLACGDGFLIETINRSAPQRSVVGVDLNTAELRAARRRLGSAQGLLRAVADRLPLASSSVSVVTAHYSLMLLHPMDKVLAEISRVLRPGGSLVAVVPARTRSAEPNGWTALRSAFAVVHDQYPIELPPIEDGRALSSTSRTELLQAAGLDVCIERQIDLRDRLDPNVAYKHLWFTYGPGLFSEEAQAQLSQEIRLGLSALTERDGLVPMIYTVQIVVATARPHVLV